MPFARRATVVFVSGLVGSALLGSVAIAGCGSHRKATGFCATIRRGQAAFDSMDTHPSRALAAFDRVAASAPAAVAPDLKIVGSGLDTLYHRPAEIAKHPAIFERYAAAIVRVDGYLHQACGVRVPHQGSLGF